MPRNEFSHSKLDLFSFREETLRQNSYYFSRSTPFLLQKSQRTIRKNLNLKEKNKNHQGKYQQPLRQGGVPSKSLGSCVSDLMVFERSKVISNIGKQM